MVSAVHSISNEVYRGADRPRGVQQQEVQKSKIELKLGNVQHGECGECAAARGCPICWPGWQQLAPTRQSKASALGED